MTFAILLFPITQASAATYYVEQRSENADDRGDGSEAHPWKSITRSVAALAPGDIVIISDGIYRETVTITRSGTAQNFIRFQAAPSANVIITGANRITRWTKEERDANVFSTTWGLDFIPWNASHTHPNDDYHLLIGRCEQVFVSGQPLRQVLDRNQLARGTFLVDFAGKRLYAWSADNHNLADEDLKCEASARSTLWDCRGNYVQTNGIHFRYAANVAQHGAAIFAGKHDVVEDCKFERTNSVGASFLAADIEVRRCTFRDNGQLGFSADRAHHLHMTDCVVSTNNTKGFSRQWEAGGDKIVLSRGVVIARSIFERNHGTGIWFDIGNEDCTVHNCLIADNEDAGLFYEISYGLHAHDNVITGNGLADTPGAWGVSSGISLSSSTNCVVERNLLVGNKEGFSFRETPRVTPRIDGQGQASEPVWNFDDKIRHNVIAYNRDAQVRGWFDLDDERHWPRALQDPPRGLGLETLRLGMWENVYAMHSGEKLLIWGTPWRRHKVYDKLDEVTRELGFEEGGKLGSIIFANPAARDFRLTSDRSIVLDAYPHGEIPGAAIGTTGK